MQAFHRLDGLAVALPAANIDTDVIMPKIFLKGIDRDGLARGLFHDLRFDAAGATRSGFVLNRPEAAGTRILVVGPNFGCGSSREHAVWGLLQFGIRAIIGTSFAGIFADNAANNGLLLISLDVDVHHDLVHRVGDRPEAMTIDLEAQTIRTSAEAIAFAIDPGVRRMLLLGLDPIGETLTHADAIRSFERAYLGARPWLVEE